MHNPSELLESAGLPARGPVRWGARLPAPVPGVYVVSTPKPTRSAPIELTAVAAWIERVPTLLLDGRRPEPEMLAERLSRFWIADEPIIYIRRAGTSVARRVRQFYRTPLGDPRPHAGGHWLKTLDGIDSLLVWWAETADPVAAEDALLTRFAEAHGGGLVLPFANRATAHGMRKPHGITGSTLGGKARPSRDAYSAPAATKPHRDLADINEALQHLACTHPAGEISAVDGASELERRGLLRDSATRPGLPLRRLLRDGLIDHAFQLHHRVGEVDDGHWLRLANAGRHRWHCGGGGSLLTAGTQGHGEDDDRDHGRPKMAPQHRGRSKSAKTSGQGGHS